jgi:hypothetical protein
VMSTREIRTQMKHLFGDDMHAKRVLSLANGVTGVIEAASLGIHAIGRGLAVAMGLDPKHAIKQVDRLLSNKGLEMDGVMGVWLRKNLAGLRRAVVAMDWTDFDKDNQATLAIHLVTKHGRSAALMWWTVEKQSGEAWRGETERAALRRFASELPEDLQVVVLADRGFGYQDLYELLTELGLDFIIRFKGNVTVETADGLIGPAEGFVPKNGRARLLAGAMVTGRRTPVPSLVFVKAKKMKDSWCLASSLSDAKAAELVHLYGRRFTIEEAFRDTKDPHFGFGLSQTRVGKPERRDRLILLAALAHSLLTMLGAASEATGLDRRMRANTVKKRTHSLLNQGLFWYRCIPTMREEWLRPLMEAFGKFVQEHEVLALAFGF